MTGQANSYFQLLSESDPFSNDWREGSFMERLTEHGDFDSAAFAQLEEALVYVAGMENLTFSWLGIMIRIVEQLTLMLRCHADPHDPYRVTNLTDEEVTGFDNRIRFLLVEISRGNTPDMSRFGR